jgi:uncharacterized protein
MRVGVPLRNPLLSSKRMPSESLTPPSRWPLALIMAALAAVFIPASSVYLRRYSLSIPAAVGIYVCFFLLCFYVVAPAMPAGRTLVSMALNRKYKHLLLVLLLALPYLAYAAGTKDFHWSGFLRVLAIPIPVALIYGMFPVRDASRFTVQDTAVAVWLVIIVILHKLNGIWNVPVNLDMMGRLFIVSLGAFCWIYIRPVPALGYALDFSKRALKAAATNFLLFSAIGIPAGLAIGFTSWNVRWHGTTAFLLELLEIFLFVGILEELFFRGFLQNLLSKSFDSRWCGQVLASCVFGLFHILHAPFPNWRYVVLASVAGWFYGSAYRESGSIFSSALVHAMVDTLWRTFFTKI